MEERLIAYLEKVWNEYTEYKEYVKLISKPVDELRKEVAKKITEATSEEDITDIYFNSVEKVMLHNGDFINQQNRLFYTVETLKNSIEIPEEIKEEVKNLKFVQIFAVKNKEATVINEEALEFTKKGIKNLMRDGVDEFKKRVL